MKKRVYVGWYKSQSQDVAHFYIGDCINRSVSACGSKTFYEPMYGSKYLRKKCKLCTSVLAARERNGILPLLREEYPTSFIMRGNS